jgi:opacity protein-like surface antigen
MKKAVSMKLLPVLVLISILILPGTGFSEATDEEGRPRKSMWDIGFNIGYHYLSTDGELDFDFYGGESYTLPEIYGQDGMFTPGFDLIYWRSLGRYLPGFVGFGLSLEIISMGERDKEFTAVGYSDSVVHLSNFTIFPVTFSVLFRYLKDQKLGKGKLTPYVGAGLGFVSGGIGTIEVRQTGVFPIADRTFETELNGQPITLNGIAGLSFMISDHTNIFAEFRYAYGTIKADASIGAEEIDIGGMTLLGGIRF